MRRRRHFILALACCGLVAAGCQEATETGHPVRPETGTATRPAAADKSALTVTVGAEELTVATSFRYLDYGPKNDCQEGHAFLKAWNPGSTGACDAPNEPFAPAIWGQSYCHFKILDADGDCMHLNSSLWGPSGPGNYLVRVRLPIGGELGEATISLPEPSDYTIIELTNYYQEPGFVLERGGTYTFQVTEQVAGCGTSRDGELVRSETVFTIPCCVGMRGNVDGDPLDAVDISDITYLVDYMFRGGPPPPCMDEADVDGDGQVDVADLDYLVAYSFSGGPAPVACD